MYHRILSRLAHTPARAHTRLRTGMRTGMDMGKGTRVALIPLRRNSSSFLQNQPSPPRLPADQQAEFERLQRAAEAKLSSHNNNTVITPSVDPLATSRHVTFPTPSPTSSSSPSQTGTQTETETVKLGGGEGTEGTISAGTFSGGIRQGAPPEFSGDKNPKTGEVGGPKNEPLRWGSEGDWSYNGRVTDF